MKAALIEGMQLAGRKTKLIHRIPFSSTTGSLGVTSIDTEKLTRKSIESEGTLDFINGPIWADLKYNWSHAHSTPTLEKVHGGKLYDTYFKPEPTAYKITWTVRNEDFFCLRWGIPAFVRLHIAANTQQLAEKLRGAVALQTYRTTGQEAQKQVAVQHLKAALRYWDTVVAITRPLYNDMPPVHLTEQKGHSWAENNKLRFHWANLRAEVATDVEMAGKAQPNGAR